MRRTWFFYHDDSGDYPKRHPHHLRRSAPSPDQPPRLVPVDSEDLPGWITIQSLLFYLRLRDKLQSDPIRQIRLGAGSRTLDAHCEDVAALLVFQQNSRAFLAILRRRRVENRLISLLSWLEKRL